MACTAWVAALAARAGMTTGAGRQPTAWAPRRQQRRGLAGRDRTWLLAVCCALAFKAASVALGQAPGLQSWCAYSSEHQATSACQPGGGTSSCQVRRQGRRRRGRGRRERTVHSCGRCADAGHGRLTAGRACQLRPAVYIDVHAEHPQLCTCAAPLACHITQAPSPLSYCPELLRPAGRYAAVCQSLQAQSAWTSALLDMPLFMP